MTSNTPPNTLSASNTAANMASQVPDYCTHCADPATISCDVCHSVKYCSVECQQADMHVHKTICSSVHAFDETPRPSPQHYRAILLPEHDISPSFVWLATTDQDICSPADYDTSFDADYGVRMGSRREICAQPRLDDWFGDSKNAELVIGKFCGGEHLDHSIRLGHRRAHIVDGKSHRNAALNYLTHNLAGSEYRGPLLLFAMSKVVDSRACKDLGPADLTVAVRAVLEVIDRRKLQYMYDLMPKPARKFKGVKVTTVQDSQGVVTPRYEEVDIPSSHPVVTESTFSTIAGQLGLGLRFWQAENTDMVHSAAESSTPALPTAYLSLALPSRPRSDSSTVVEGFGEMQLTDLQKSATTMVIDHKHEPVMPFYLGFACRFIENVAQPKLLRAPATVDAQYAALSEMREEWAICKQELLQELRATDVQE